MLAVEDANDVVEGDEDANDVIEGGGAELPEQDQPATLRMLEDAE